VECFRPKIRRWLLPPQRRRAVPWGVLEIVVLVIVVEWFLPGMFLALVRDSGLLDRMYGPHEFKLFVTEKDAQTEELHLIRASLLGNLLALPVQLAAILGICRLWRNAQPYQLGLTTHRLRQNVLAGFIGWFLLTPTVLACSYAVKELFTHILPTEIQTHALLKLSRTGWDPFLMLFTAVVYAPLIEEILFRGLLQPWLMRRAWGGLVGLGMALGLALLVRMDALFSSYATRDWGGIAKDLLPAAFVVVMAPGYLLSKRFKRPEVAGAIYGSALVFAAAHSAVWPDPVPLFVLALGLGWLAYRTQSLVGSIVLHALFNGVACWQFLTMNS
jgi:membrane protease YdiL (CAAX protease family)